MDDPHAIHLDGDVDTERDGVDENKENEEEEDEEEEEEEEKEEEGEDEDEKEDDDEVEGKDPWMIGQGEMVHTLADNVDTIIDDQPMVHPEYRQEIREHTPQPRPPATAPLPHAPEPGP